MSLAEEILEFFDIPETRDAVHEEQREAIIRRLMTHFWNHEGHKLEYFGCFVHGNEIKDRYNVVILMLRHFVYHELREKLTENPDMDDESIMKEILYGALIGLGGSFVVREFDALKIEPGDESELEEDVKTLFLHQDKNVF